MVPLTSQSLTINRKEDVGNPTINRKEEPEDLKTSKLQKASLTLQQDFTEKLLIIKIITTFSYTNHYKNE